MKEASTERFERGLLCYLVVVVVCDIKSALYVGILAGRYILSKNFIRSAILMRTYANHTKDTRYIAHV